MSRVFNIYCKKRICVLPSVSLKNQQSLIHISLSQGLQRKYITSRCSTFQGYSSCSHVGGISSDIAVRPFASTAATTAGSKPPIAADLEKLRNIGISAHIDSGKTTLTERILFYTGRILDIHEVRGKDGVGAKMDSMELEREKGITIQSAATFCNWKGKNVNIIDTPGHVDFTIEVERALRVLDGAVLVLCAVAGVQSQTMTVDRQMKRYNVPRIVFINKMDRTGANPGRCIDLLQEKLKMNAVPLQIPVGLEEHHKGVIDLIEMKYIECQGEKGEEVVVSDIPESLMGQALAEREHLIYALADVDEEIEQAVVEEQEIYNSKLMDAIRRATIAQKFVPVLMGSAYKNKGVQLLLDAVVAYLPHPGEVKYKALEVENEENEVSLHPSPSLPLVALAFKLEETRFGQLTYMRIYQGQMKRGDNFTNVRSRVQSKVPRLVRMHSNEMVDIQQVEAGDIVAMFGVECASGDTFCGDGANVSLSSMFVPAPVMSLAVTCASPASMSLGKALSRFAREDPTFRVSQDEESGETIIAGMGELHLMVYVERLNREFDLQVTVGAPRVALRETVTRPAKIDHTLKKQTGGSGQFARVVGTLAPASEEVTSVDLDSLEFDNKTVGGSIPPQYINACEKGFFDACERGPLTGSPIAQVNLTLTDGASHAVDSSEMAFRTCVAQAVKLALKEGNPQILEPIMNVEILVPSEHQGTVVGALSRRQAVIMSSELQDEYAVIQAQVPLNQMFGYSTDLRSATEGKGEFSMEYSHHGPMTREDQEKAIRQYGEENDAQGPAKQNKKK